MFDSRFRFGQNWTLFAQSITEQHIARAAESLERISNGIRGKTFLDVGCGSGIHSLAAVRCGARMVHSFDCDLESVECARRLRTVWASDADWTIEPGSALNVDYLKSLGQFDVVYSWGVLHHTGDLWTALNLITLPASDLLIISVYNDQGTTSRLWRTVKRWYNHSGAFRQRTMEALVFLLIWGKHAIANLLRLRPLETVRNWRNYSKARGMSPWIDVVDWVGGYPFEVAKPADVVAFYRERGFHLAHATLCGNGKGCNEFAFRRAITVSTPPTRIAELPDRCWQR